MITDISDQATYRGDQLGNIDGFIFHHTGGRGTPQSVVNTLNQRGLGTQYVMDRDGSIYRTLPAGARGAQIMNSPNTNLSNANTEGMEIIANDNNDLTPAQIASARQFGVDYAQQHPGVQFYGHGMINPGHKEPTEGYTVTNEVRSALGQPTIAPGGVAPGAYTPVTGGGGATPSASDNRQIFFDALTQKAGLTPQQALGALWGLGGESGPTISTTVERADGSLGGAQWKDARRTGLEAFAQSQGKPATDPYVQANYLVAELQGHGVSGAVPAGVLDALKQAPTAQDATRIWVSQVERPKVDNSDARIAQGSHVGTLDAQGNLMLGDKAPSTPTAVTTATPGGSGAATATPAATTPAAPAFIPLTPEQRFDMSIGQTLASLGGGGTFGGGGSISAGTTMPDPGDEPAIRTPALSEQMTGPSPIPASFAGGVGSGSIGAQLGSLAIQPGADPTGAMLSQNAPSITQGAPSMTAMLGGLGTSDTFNYLDPRRTVSPALTMRQPRLA